MQRGLGVQICLIPIPRECRWQSDAINYAQIVISGVTFQHLQLLGRSFVSPQHPLHVRT
ncbi:hypothetical protein HispidOSU_020617, partial [Sigmodon hispidus]